MSGPYVLAPVTVTDAMLTSSTIAEPSATEAVWVAATSYTVGTEVIRIGTHRVYENLIAGVDATAPELAPTRWLDKRPTQRWAVFDGYITTQSSAATSMTYVLRPGLFNAIAAYSLDGATLTLSVKDAPGGTVVFSKSYALAEAPLDYYDYYFGRYKPLTKLLEKGIAAYVDPEVTITVTTGAGVTVKAGMFVFGDLREIVSVAGTGGVQRDARAKPTTTSLFVADGFGGTKIVKRTKATDMDISVFLAQTDADSALLALQDVLDVPAAWIGSDAAGFAGLNVFGLASGDVTYAGLGFARMTVNVKGLI